METREERFMRMAVELSLGGVHQGKGGPFGAVVVRGEEVLGRGCNEVLALADPTAHAEIVAIRQACLRLGSYQLTGCEIYASSEPCPMCLGAIYWARPDKIYYANTRDQAAEIGFDDDFIYRELALPPDRRKIPFIAVRYPAARDAFALWKKKTDKQTY